MRKKLKRLAAGHVRQTGEKYISSLKQIRTRCGDRPGNEKKNEKRYRRKTRMVDKKGLRETSLGDELKRERHVREAREGGT